mmetsp:Transcript_40288/g.78403  ORF Transcript_40288/g.78403 Transcript_40288/m.78403 type:complete len:237 (+) Transcript_40288:635-1345(+)
MMEEIPKSQIRIRKSLVTNTFRGLMSRWKIPMEWRNENPIAMSMAICIRRRIGRGVSRKHKLSRVFGTYSIQKNHPNRSEKPMPNKRTMNGCSEKACRMRISSFKDSDNLPEPKVFTATEPPNKLILYTFVVPLIRFEILRPMSICETCSAVMRRNSSESWLFSMLFTATASSSRNSDMEGLLAGSSEIAFEIVGSNLDSTSNVLSSKAGASFRSSVRFPFVGEVRSIRALRIDSL